MGRSTKKIKPKWNYWMTLVLFGAFGFGKIDSIHAHQKGRLMVPLSYSAFTTDLRVQLQWDNGQQQQMKTSTQDLRLQLTRIDDMSRVLISIFDIYPDPRSNITQITLPCQYFLRGGFYELEIIGNDINSTIDERLKQQLDVRWPQPKLSVTPESIGTYPQEPLNAILEYPGVECLLPNNDVSPDVPEFWLELLYCGHDVYCDSANVTKSQILYSEQVRGFPKTRIVQLRCDLFGLAGHYVFKLKPTGLVPSSVSASAYIKADWSEQFVFNVHARSIFPCDPHSGIKVLFEYPACILDQGDRVRLFAKLRADVASLAPPTSLHYVTEQRVVRGQHALHFDCDLFSEKYVEYCFVYVSQAITGAVADVRMDCVPTLPVSDSDTGGWGPWSSWTPCSTTCAGGTRNRYRFCDSPPPRYGAKFCEGSAVETERCGGPISGTWECIYGSGSYITGEVPADRPEIIAEIGPGCRCGCIVHLGMAKPRRLVASSSHSCPGRSFWLIQADEGHKIRFKLDFFRLPCVTQSLKIRDGDSLAAELIGQYYGGNGRYPDAIISSTSQILLEFFSNELASMGQSCGGGFLAHAQQIQQNITIPSPSKTVMTVSIAPVALKLTIVHIFAILFVSIIIVISILLGAQYVFRYRKYQLAESIGEPDSPAHTPRVSLTSYPDVGPPSRAISTTTLLSEVISLVKLRPRVHQRMKHTRLRESIDVETLEKTENFNENENYNENENEDEMKSHSDDDNSIGSTHTLTNINLNNLDNSIIRKKNHNNNLNNRNYNDTLSLESGSPPSNNSISLPPTPVDTPIPIRKLQCRGETKSINGKTRKNKLRDVSPVREEQDTEIDTDSTRIGDKRFKMLSGCYSPASSMISTATIRTNNQKESKEKQNRERLLAGPGSEFSLTNPEELELDYYDYNVTNAGAAPGSYLGMDPAYLVWIPPIDEGNILNEIEHERIEHHYEEILPRCNSVDPGSNTETPDDEDVPELPIKQVLNKNNLNYRNIAANTLKLDSPIIEQRNSNKMNYDGIQLQEYPSKNNRFQSPAKIHRKRVHTEKETAVVKSPSDYYELDDIQFADDDLDDNIDNNDDNEDDDIDNVVNKNNGKLSQSKFHIKT